MTISKKIETILLLGLPGSGKGTQCKKLIEKYNLKILSSGQVLRDYTSREPDKYAKSIVTDLMNREVEENSKFNFILLDGFPRCKEGYDYVQSKFDIKCVIWLELSETICRHRMLNRSRSDDVNQSISTRFEEFSKYGRPALNKIKQEQIFYEVSAQEEPNVIHESICAILEKYLDRKQPH